MIRIKNMQLVVGASIVAVMLGVMLTLTNTVSAQGRRGVLQSVHAGSPDACAAFGLPDGCDANYSLTALMFADGTVEGKYTDVFAGGFVHTADIDCLNIIGKDAWVSGVLIAPPQSAGLPFSARVQDNGTSANDTPDMISFSMLGDAADLCDDMVDYPLFELMRGQVRIK